MKTFYGKEKKSLAYVGIMNMICIRVDKAGEHYLWLGPPISAARRLGAWIAAMRFLLFTAVLIVLEIRNVGKLSGKRERKRWNFPGR